MADSVLMYGVSTGIFAFLVAVLFVSRGTRKRRGSTNEGMRESHSSSEPESQGKRIKKFRSDGTPVYD